MVGLPSPRKGIFFPSSVSTILAMQEIKEVQEIGPIIQKLLSHWRTIGMTIKTLILLTATYKIISSSFCIVLESPLEKKVMVIHLWKKTKRGMHNRIALR